MSKRIQRYPVMYVHCTLLGNQKLSPETNAKRMLSFRSFRYKENLESPEAQ